MTDYYFEYERLDCYRLALEVAHWVADQKITGSLGDQVSRASQSVVLNIAEGCGQSGKSRQNHFRIARGSAAETCAALDLLRRKDGSAQQQKLRRIGIMLRVM